MPERIDDTRPDAADASYQGAPGAYSEQAAFALFGRDARLLPRPTLEDMFDAVARGEAWHAVLPVENCLAGTVPGAYELLSAHAMRAIGETRVQIEHVLVAPPGVELPQIRRVVSHPVALAQCRTFFASHPAIEPVPAFDTAGAVDMVMRVRDGRSAALASRRSAALYGGTVIAAGFQDHAENWTRFLLVARSDAPREAEGPHKALVMFELPHRPGALAEALLPIGRHGVNLTRIHSQAIHGRPFEYRFSVEMAGASAAAVRSALEAMQSGVPVLELFGLYPDASSECSGTAGAS